MKLGTVGFSMFLTDRVHPNRKAAFGVLGAAAAFSRKV